MITLIFSVYYFILGIFALLGIVDILLTLAKRSYLPAKCFHREEKVYVLPLQGRQENIEYVIRSIISNQNSYFSKCRLKIFCLDINADEETKKICNLLARDYNFIKLISLKSKIHHSD